MSQSRAPRRSWTATWRGCTLQAQQRAFRVSARGRPRGGGVVAGLEADLRASLPPWHPWTAARRGCCWHLPISGRRDGPLQDRGWALCRAQRSVDRLGLKVTGADDPEGGGGGEANVGGEAGDGGGVGTTAAPEASTSKGVASQPFILSEGLPPVPHKLVLRVLLCRRAFGCAIVWVFPSPLTSWKGLRLGWHFSASLSIPRAIRTLSPLTSVHG